MKQVININFQGVIIPIENTAYDKLKKYIDSLNNYFANEIGKDEIINDIEVRISELLQARLKKGATCIVDEDIDAVIAVMGKVEDFERMEEDNSSTTSTGNANTSERNFTANPTSRRLFRDGNDKMIGGVASGLANYLNVDPTILRVLFVILFCVFGTGIFIYLLLWLFVPITFEKQNNIYTGPTKKLFRDTENSWIGGVCSGIAHYFNINVIIPRLLFILPFFKILKYSFRFDFFEPLTRVGTLDFETLPLLIYIILWLVLPEAKTRTDKMQMKGEKVDVNNISNNVMEEMKSFGNNMQNSAKDIGNTINNKANTIVREIKQTGNNNGIGKIIATLVKICIYFIIGIVAVTLILAIISGILAFIQIWPYRDYILETVHQRMAAQGFLIFGLITPFIYLIVWFLRKLTGSKNKSPLNSWGFSSLFTLGLICFFFLISSLGNSIKTKEEVTETIKLKNPATEMLLFEGGSKIKGKKIFWNVRSNFNFGLIKEKDDNTILTQMVMMDFTKSDSNVFKLELEKSANGRNMSDAAINAKNIDFKIDLVDSNKVVLPEGIPITKPNKYRLQAVRLNVHVPVGKKIKLTQGVENLISSASNSSSSFIENFYFEKDKVYVMTKDYGLVEEEDYDSATQNPIYIDNEIIIGNGKSRLRNRIMNKIRKSEIKLDSIEEKKQKEALRKLDSLDKEVEELKERQKKIEQAKENIESSTASINFINPALLFTELKNW